MSKKTKYCLVLLLSVVIFHTQAQNNTSSPYSLYGIGDIAGKYFGQQQSMGGTSFGMRSPLHLNLNNPASYSVIHNRSFVYEFGLQNKNVNFKTETDKASASDINIQYIAMGFPIYRSKNENLALASSFGLVPFSDIGYNVNIPSYIDGIGNVQYNYYGKGGLNELYYGLSVELWKRVSLGVNATFLFGDLVETNSFLVADSSTSSNNYMKETRSIIKDMGYINAGIQYYDTLGSDWLICGGIVFDNATRLNVSQTILSGTTSFSRTNPETLSGLSTTIIDTVIPKTDVNTTLILPTNFGVGVSIGKINQFVVALDYYQQNWGNSTVFNESDSLSNSSRISLGAEWVPDYKASSSKYFKRICYRLGGHYNKTYVQIFDNQILDLGVSLGFGFPIRQKGLGKANMNSSLNISFEYGQRGTIKDNLIKENYFIISLNLTLYDNSWFFKRKFD